MAAHAACPFPVPACAACPLAGCSESERTAVCGAAPAGWGRTARAQRCGRKRACAGGSRHRLMNATCCCAVRAVLAAGGGGGLCGRRARLGRGRGRRMAQPPAARVAQLLGCTSCCKGGTQPAPRQSSRGPAFSSLGAGPPRPASNSASAAPVPTTIRTLRSLRSRLPAHVIAPRETARPPAHRAASLLAQLPAHTTCPTSIPGLQRHPRSRRPARRELGALRPRGASIAIDTIAR
jgi:hypothetical protein